MKNQSMRFDTRNTKIYKDIYRPSSNISRFLGTLLSVILVGNSPVNNLDHTHSKRTK